LNRPLRPPPTVQTRQELVRALHQLRKEAFTANLGVEAAAIAQVATAIDQSRATGAMETVWAPPDEAELLRAILAHCTGNAGERRLRLQALAEVSTLLSISDLTNLAFVSEHQTPHLRGFLALFDQHLNSTLSA